jgi:hypothetical protein
MVLGSSANVMAETSTTPRACHAPLVPLRSGARGKSICGRCSIFNALLFFVATPMAFAEELRLDHSSLTSAVESIRVDDLKTHVNTLASDALQGREAGTTAGHAASAYLVQELRKQAVAPAGPGGHYLQEFNGAMRNILASVPGRDAKFRDEVVIVCAHYDHVGYGTPRNSRGPIGYIHNGADDNASGTAGLLEVIDAVRSLPQPPRRTLLFAFWDGEEKGLLGSKHWLTAPTRPLNQIKLVINADMIGRLRPEGVEVTGTRAARGLRDLVSEANSTTFAVPPLGDVHVQPVSNPPEGGTTNLAPQARLDFTWDMRADSDHHPFFAAGIPALMLHTGKHDDYHRPSDDADKINYAGTQQLARLMLMLALRAAEADELPTFRPESRGETKEHQRLVEQPRPAPASRLGLTWSSQLAEQRIVEVIDVAPQSPAAAAGFHIGDRLERFAGYAVSDVADFRSLVVIADRDVTATVRRPGSSAPLELSVRLNGEPTRLGLTWRTDDAEPNSVILTQVLPHSPAALSGLQPLDRVRILGDHPATHAHVTQTAASLSLPIQVSFERDGVLATTSITPITSTTVATKPSDNSSN